MFPAPCHFGTVAVGIRGTEHSHAAVGVEAAGQVMLRMQDDLTFEGELELPTVPVHARAMQRLFEVSPGSQVVVTNRCGVEKQLSRAAFSPRQTEALVATSVVVVDRLRQTPLLKVAAVAVASLPSSRTYLW